MPFGAQVVQLSDVAMTPLKYNISNVAMTPLKCLKVLLEFIKRLSTNLLHKFCITQITKNPPPSLCSNHNISLPTYFIPNE